jgi:hypothetical protein
MPCPSPSRPGPGNNDFSGELIVRAKPRAARSASTRIAPLMTRQSAFSPEFVVKVPAGMTEGELAGVLMATGDYQFVEPNWVLYPLATTPNDPDFSASWQHTRMQSTLAWDITTGSPDVIVAVCDSGVDQDHPDLAAALVPGYNAVNNLAQVNGGQVDAINGHGTFVAGCAAAIGNNARGVVGAGWNLKIMPVRVSNNAAGTANQFDLTEGARWAAANGAKAINVSYSGANNGSNDVAALDVKLLGGLLLWASGNDGAFVGGIFPHLTIVGSTTSSDAKSGFSNFGTAVDITAPGSGVRSTTNGGGYGNGSGTSYACPMATGVAAMIFSANPNLAPDDVQDVLYTSSDDLGTPGYDQNFGWGRVNTFKAVTQALTYVPRTPLPLTESFDSAAWTTIFAGAAGTPTLEIDPEAPSGNSALAIDAGESVETVPLAGATAFGAGLSTRVAVRAEGVPAGNALRVEYLNESSAWITLYEAVSPGIDTPYIVHDELLPYEFARHNVKVRLIAEGNDGRWLVDDFSIDEQSVNPLPFAETFDTARISPNAWTALSGTGIELLGNDFAMSMPNDATATTVKLRLVDLAAFEQWAWFYLSGNGLTFGDVLTIEYRSGGVGWTNLALVDLEGIGAAAQGVEIQLPFGVAASSDFQLRMTSSTAGGTLFVDDVNIGASRLPDEPVGCSAADLAEPFGSLNFFDVSAFLGAYNAADPAADLAEPTGTFNFFDVSAFLGLYNAGCP